MSSPGGEAVDLRELGDELLDRARTEHAGRAARTLPHPSEGLRQTLVALRAGAELGEHESPGPATLQVLRGRVRLVAGSMTVELAAHQMGPVPAHRHSLSADEDAVVLLSVGRSG